jgi:DNA polymerase III subunit delta
LDGLQAEGVSEVLVHYTLAEDIRALKRVKDAVSAGRPLPQVLREQRVWGQKERLFERVLPQLSACNLRALVAKCAPSGWDCERHEVLPTWPTDSWQALLRLALMLCNCSPR